jgi:hypothetical protein
MGKAKKYKPFNKEDAEEYAGKGGFLMSVRDMINMWQGLTRRMWPSPFTTDAKYSSSKQQRLGLISMHLF